MLRHGSSLTAVLILLILNGCSGPKAARELSRETLAHTIEYEQSLKGLGRSLAANYERQLNQAREIITRSQDAEIIAVQLQLSEDTADKILLRGFAAHQLREHVQTVVAERKRIASAHQSKLQNIEETLGKAIKAASVKEKRLQTVRTKLESLQTSPGLADRISALKPYFEAARDAIKASGQ